MRKDALVKIDGEVKTYEELEKPVEVVEEVVEVEVEEAVEAPELACKACGKEYKTERGLKAHKCK